MHAVSRTGTPRGHMRGNGAHVFGPAPATMRRAASAATPATKRRAASANQYEKKQLERKQLGSYESGGYYRISRTGTPRGHAKSIPIFGGPVDKTRPNSAPAIQPDRQAETFMRYVGKVEGSAEDPCKAQLGLFGAGECVEKCT